MKLKPSVKCTNTKLNTAQADCGVPPLPGNNRQAGPRLMDDKHCGTGRVKAIFPALQCQASFEQHTTPLCSWSFMQNSTSLVLRTANSLFLLNIEARAGLRNIAMSQLNHWCGFFFLHGPSSNVVGKNRNAWDSIRSSCRFGHVAPSVSTSGTNFFLLQITFKNLFQWTGQSLAWNKTSFHLPRNKDFFQQSNVRRGPQILKRRTQQGNTRLWWQEQENSWTFEIAEWKQNLLVVV